MKYLTHFLLYPILGWLVGQAPVFGQENQVVTLSYCQAEVIANYPSVKDKALLQAATELKLKNINTSFYPQLSLNGQATYQSEIIDIAMQLPNGNTLAIKQAHDQYKATLDINQLIYDGGITRSQRKLEQSSLAADQQQVEVDLYKVREQVNNAYFLLLNLQENKKLLTNTFNELCEREKQILSSVKNGILMQSDHDALKAEKLKLEQLLSDIHYNEMAASNILSILINKPLPDSARYELPLLEIKDSSVASRPEYRLFELQTARIEDSKSLSSSVLKPKVYAFAQGGYGRPGLNMLSDKFNTFYIVGASFKWTLWDWSKSSRERQVLDVKKQMISTRRETFDKNLSIDLQNRLAAIQKLEEALKRDTEIIELRTRVTKSSASRLDNGVITSTDYLTDLNAETAARINYETHKIQLVQAKANYQLAKGNI